MNSTDTSTLKKLKKLYSAAGYMKRYGTDVWVSAIICIVFIYLINRYYIVNLLEVIKADWPNQKCNPLIMPFAGFINKPTNQSSFEYTANNFTTCVYDIIKFFTRLAISPYQMVLKIINAVVNEIQDAVNSLRSLFDGLRSMYSDLIGMIYSILSNISVTFLHTVIKLRDTLNKGYAVMVNALFVVFGSFLAMESFFLIIIDLITIILIAIVATLVVLIATAVIMNAIIPIGPVISIPAIISAVAVGLILIGILIPVIIIEIFLLRILKLSVPPPPKVPSCFAGNTLVKMAKGEKQMKDIEIGEKISGGGIVTAIFKNSATGQNVYDLQGVKVTGEHRVFHPSAKWIKVKDHPASIYLPKFAEPYVYCLNTTTKTFQIGDTTFSDWDDIDEEVLEHLNRNCVEPGFLPEKFLNEDIHLYLESGFEPLTLIKMEDGSFKPICKINVNERLYNNTVCLGVVKVNGRDINQYKHTFKNGSYVCGAKNVHVADNNLGTVNCMQSEPMAMQSEPMCSEPTAMRSEPTAMHPVLYHLLTDTKFFIANTINVNDYNYGIDAYLI